MTVSVARSSGHETSLLIAFALESFGKPLPPAVMDASRRITLDTIACSVGAFGTEQARAILAVKRVQGGRPEATLAVYGDRLPAATVAYIHAQLSNVLDADETYQGSLHLAAPIVTPAIAAAESAGATGAELLSAIAIGFEVAARVGASLEAYEASGDTVLLAPVRGFDWAGLGTAVAVGLLRGLDATQLANAVGIAFATLPVNYDIRRCTMPLFTPGQPAIWHKYAMYGAIAEAGYNAVLLAEQGFKGDPDILDGDSGYWRSLGATTVDVSALTTNLGTGPWAIAETSIKPYPFCRHGHRALDLFRQIVLDNGLRPDDVDEVVVVIPPYETLQRIVENDWPDEQLKIMMSLQFALWMLVSGVPSGPLWWAAEHLEDPAGQEWGKRVRCVVEPAWREILTAQISEGGLFSRYPVRVEVSGQAGTWSAQADYPRGVNDPAEFRFSDSDLDAKAAEFMAPILGKAQAARVVEALEHLEQAPNVNELVRSYLRPV
jgi:2-methylcitrate dehydratase PrpD